MDLELDRIDERGPFLNLAGLLQAGVIVLAVLLGVTLDVPAWSTFRLDAVDALIGLAAALPMFLVIYVSNDLNELVVRTIGRPLSNCRWYDLLALAVLVGFGEEFLFRGVLPIAGERLGFDPMVALVGANLLFAACHAASKAYFIAAFLLGCYLSAVMTSGPSPNLLRPVIAHAVYDFVAFLWVAAEWRRTNEADSGEESKTNPADPESGAAGVKAGEAET